MIRLAIAFILILISAAADAQVGQALRVLVPAPTGACIMNGKFDLTNTCNIIYFIGTLK